MTGLPALTLAGCLVLLPVASRAQQEALFPISEVVAAFKREIRIAQSESGGACTYTIETVDFEFQVARGTGTVGGAGAKFEVLGFEAGGSAETSQSQTATSLVKLRYVPRPDAGMEEVSGSALDEFAELILQTKDAIEAAAEQDDALQVARLVIDTKVDIERIDEYAVKIVVTGEGSESRSGHHRVTLTLGPGKDSRC